MPRYKLVVEYDGTGFAGWQRQNGLPTIQEKLEDAICHFSQEKVSITVAGRTDAGVHALGQVVHFDLRREFSLHQIRDGINFHLRDQSPEGVLKICVLAAERVNEEFNARFSAIKRHYLYRILMRQAPPVVNKNRVFHVRDKLDIRAMQGAAKILVGKHDFSSFRAAECQAKSPVKTLDKIEIEPVIPCGTDKEAIEETINAKGMELHLKFSATSFMHHMVRNIVGTLHLVGVGKLAPADMAIILEARDRTKAGPTAPACGLYLVKVEY